MARQRTTRQARFPSIGGNIFHEEQVRAILDDLGIEIVSESDENFQCLCPFHHNTSSPAFTVSQQKGLFYCFSPDCGEKGNLNQLIQKLKDFDRFETRRFISQYGDVDYSKQIKKALEHAELEPFSQKDIDEMHKAFPMSDAHRYMDKRGFDKDTLKHFMIGTKGNLVTVPMHDFRGMPVGYVGRSIHEKAFYNSDGLPSSKTLWNLHRAKGNDTAIIVEASFDAMMIHQAGYPNVVATLKGHISKYQVDYLHKYFTSVLVFADNDDGPGIELGMEVKRKVQMPQRWANFDYYDGLKDATDLREKRIRDAIRNSLSHAEMLEIAA